MSDIAAPAYSIGKGKERSKLKFSFSRLHQLPKSLPKFGRSVNSLKPCRCVNYSWRHLREKRARVDKFVNILLF